MMAELQTDCVEGAAREQQTVASPFVARTLSDWFEWALPYAWAAGLDSPPCLCRIAPQQGALYWNGRPVFRGAAVESLQAVAEWYVCADWAERLTDRRMVYHAAALERHGGALLLFGGPGMGKSTLALRLVRRGFRYLGDEFAVVRPDTLEALAFPKALCLKASAADLAARGDPQFEVIAYPPGFAPRYNGARCCLPREGIVPPAGERFPVRWGVFLDEKSAAHPPVGLPRWQAAVSVYESSLRSDREAFHAAAALARRATFWRMGRDDGERMSDGLVDLVELDPDGSAGT